MQIDSIFTRPMFQNEKNSDLWKNIIFPLLPDSVYKYKVTTDLYKKLLLQDNLPASIPQQALLRIVSDEQENRHFLPIELMKHGQFSPKEILPTRTFRSSGTISEDRSFSHFSSDGLLLYQSGSLLTFFSVMNNYFPDPISTHGISLIPKTQVWKDSSLAQMVEWISEYFKIDYLEPHELTTSFIRNYSEPVFIFSTALHLISVLNEKTKIPLPKGSIIFETGGYKSATVQFERDEFYEKISQKFNISKDYIVSEYGMSEMASQAYDWVQNPSHTNPRSLKQRSFRFPIWIETFVMPAQGKLIPTGFGPLVINDPLRIDYPWLLRTQDLVEILGDNQFTLKGRVPHSVLKGCSINAEDLPQNWTESKNKLPCNFLKNDHLETIQHPSREVIERRVNFVSRNLKLLLQETNFIPFLTQETGLELLSKLAANDILEGLPTLLDDWYSAVRNSFGKNEFISQNWLLILPRSHPQALFYPIILGYICGIKFYIRQTSLDQKSAEYLALKHIQSWPESNITLLEPSFRIGESEFPFQSGSVMAFGSDDSMTKLKSTCNFPLTFFGSILTGTVLSYKDLFSTPESLFKIMKDCFSLAQKGCFSSRFIVLVAEERINLINLCTQLDLAAQMFLRKEINIISSIALDHEQIQQSVILNRISNYRNEGHSPLFILNDRTKNNLNMATLKENLSTHQFCVPVFVMSHVSFIVFIEEMLLPHNDIKRLSISLEIQTQFAQNLSKLEPFLDTCPLGNANTPKFNGLHCKKPFFDTN